jgi:iron complex outermembrane recepter protein
VINNTFVTIPRDRNYEESSPNLYRTLFTALTWSHDFDQDWSIKQQFAYYYLDDNLPLIGYPTDVVSASPALFPSGLAFTRANQQLQQYDTTISSNVDITGHIDTFGVKHTLLVGGDVYRFTDTQAGNFPYGESLIEIFNPIHPGILTPPGGAPFPFASYSPQTTAGLYLQDQIALPYNFFVLAGARYQYIGQSSETGSALQSLTPAGNSLVAQAVTPRYGLLWRPQEWLSLYGTYTEGFGPNTGLIYPGTLAPPSSAKSWEAGVKLESIDKRLRATVGYFDLTKTNIETPDLLAGQQNFVVVTGAARSKGVEADVRGSLLPGWDVIAAYVNEDVIVTSGSGGEFGTRPWASTFPACRGISQDSGPPMLSRMAC